MTVPRQTLVADIEDFITKSEDRLLAVMRGSLRDMCLDMQKPTGAGGRMRVDTGFLQQSGGASLDGFPVGPSKRPRDAVKGQFTFDITSLDSALLNMKLGDTFFWGWTAEYAPIREVYDGFMDTALQNWQGYVTTNSERFRGK